MTYIKMKFILGVTLLVIQLSSTRAGIGATTANIVSYIRGENFKKAFNEARKVEDLQTTMNAVIRQVYNNDFRNIDLILKFVNSKSTETEVSFAVYKALSNQLQSDVPYLDRLNIMESFNSKPFHSEDEKVARLKKKLHDSVTNVLAAELKDALKNKNSPKVTTLCEDMEGYYPESFESVIRNVLNEAFDEIDTRYLVKFFMSNKHASQSISVYSEVLKKINLDQPLAVTIAFGIKHAIDKSTDPEIGGKGYSLINELPLSTRNLALYSDAIAIVNEKYGEYLYAANDFFIYPRDPSRQRRQIFTWTKKEKVTQGIWGVEQHGDAYWIRNIRNSSHSEYLFRSSLHPGFQERFIFTWIPGPPDDEIPKQFEWEFEPSGDSVYIKNKRFNEYLYASEEYEGFGTDRRHIYTDRDRRKLPGSLWKIKSYYYGSHVYG